MKSGPLKIGIACFPLIGGSGILATALGSELARRGHEVYFFSYAQPVRLDLPQDNLHFHRVDVAHNPLFPSPDYTLPLAVKMAEVARSQQLDLFHVHYAVPHALAACLASQMLGRSAPRIVTTLHGTDTTLLGQDPDYRMAIEHALVHSDAVTAVSESLRHQTQETFRLKRPIEVIPNFFTPNNPKRSREEVRRELGIADEFLVLHMSSLRPVKRIDLLLRTIAMSKNRERVRLFILAGGPFDPYQPLLDELQLRDRVIIHQNTAVVDEYVQAADAGLYTSEYESFGLSILETMFYQKPVLAFRVGGIPEVIGDSSLLYPFGDVAAAAAGLDTLIESPDLARELGGRGRNRALEQFSADRILPRYEELYRRVIAAANLNSRNQQSSARSGNESPLMKPDDAVPDVPPASLNPEKDPDEWVTKDEPMTGPQRSYLQTLCREAGKEFDQNWTKAEASKKIEELQQKTGRGKGDRSEN